MIECLTPDVGWYERNLPPSLIKYKISDDNLLSSLMEVVDKSGDRMAQRTNLFCKITEYRSQRDTKYKKAFDGVIEIVESIFDENKLNFKVTDIWVAQYKSQDLARKHDHTPASWSFCLYLNEGEGFPPLELKDCKKVYPEKGLIVFFPGWVLHEVKTKEFDGARYVCSGNCYEEHQRVNG